MFSLSKFEASLVQFSFFIAYFVVSFIYFIISVRGRDPINRYGYKNAMTFGLTLAGIGCLLFYPAAKMESFYFFLFGLFVLSSGITILQIAANPFVAILGPSEKASMRLNLAQGLNSFGTTIGPIVGTLMIFNLFSDGFSSPDSVGKTYVVYGCTFLIFAILTMRSGLPVYKNDSQNKGGVQLKKHKNLMLGILAIFCYVGAEVSVGNWVGKLIQQPDIANLSEQDANFYLAFFWGGLMIGRICGSLAMSDNKFKHIWNAVIPLSIFFFIYLSVSIVISLRSDPTDFQLVFPKLADFMYYLVDLALFYVLLLFSKGHPAKSLLVFACTSILLLGVSIFSEGYLTTWSVLGVGLFCSIMWSNIFTLSIKGLGKYTSQGSSLLIMAIVGGAIFPVLQGLVADSFSIQLSFVVPLVGFIYLVFYGLYAIRNEKNIA